MGGKSVGVSGNTTVDVTSNSTSLFDSNANINSASTNQIDSNANAQLQVVGLDNIRLKADATSDSKTQLEMDLKPLQMDLCLKLGLERLPPTRICQPVSRHLGFTVLSVEVFGLNYSSEQNTIIEDIRNRAFIAGDLGRGCDGRHGGQEHESVRIRLGD